VAATLWMNDIEVFMCSTPKAINTSLNFLFVVISYMTYDKVYFVYQCYSPLQSTTANSAVPVSLSGKKGAAAS